MASVKPDPDRQDSVQSKGQATVSSLQGSTEVASSIDPSERTTKTTLWKEIRKYPRLSAYALGLALAFLFAGYDTVIVGTITGVPYFKEKYGEFYNNKHIIPSWWLSLWSAFSPIGGMIGAAAAGWLQDRIGRRFSLVVACVVTAIGIAIAFISDLPGDKDSRRGAFLVARIVQGFGVGGAMAGAQTYMSETIPTTLRGSAMALSPTFLLFGQLIGAGVIKGCQHRESSTAYLIPFGTQWIITLLPFCLAILIPESPSYLLEKGQEEKATRSLKKLHGPSTNIEPVLEQLRIAIIHKRELCAGLTYKDCFTGIDLRRTLIVAFSFMLPSLFGVPLLTNAAYFLQTVGMSSGLSIVVLIIGIVLGILGNAVGVNLMSRFERRPLMLGTLAITTVVWLSMGIAGCFSGNVVAWYTAGCLMAVVIFCGIGVWPASFAVSGEASSLRLRAKTQGVGVFFYELANVVFELILPYIYNTDSGDLRAKTGFVYFGFTLLALVLTWYLIPDMKGRTALEIDEMFESKLPARSFRTWNKKEPAHQVEA